MIRTPSGKNLMNLQEAVQWLLDNNALPFQCTADYVGGAEIGLGTIVNPTPAKVRVGSLIFFADSKVSTVIAITSNSFICSEEYNDLVDDVVYVSNVQLNASAHLIVTLSNGTNIDAGLIKEATSFSINDSQHLIANYNDGTHQDLGAIFSGDVTITGDFVAKTIKQNQVNFSVPFVTGNTPTGLTVTDVYNRFEQIGNILYVIVNMKIENNSGSPVTFNKLGETPSSVTVPEDVSVKLIDINGNDGTTTPSPTCLLTIDDMLFIKGTVMNSTSGASVKRGTIGINHRSANAFGVFMYFNETVTLDDGEVGFASCRMPITLL